jgi:hypothetical protein
MLAWLGIHVPNGIDGEMRWLPADHRIAKRARRDDLAPQYRDEVADIVGSPVEL